MSRQVEIQRLAIAVGNDIRDIKSSTVTVVSTLGQSDKLAVSQKLLTDKLGDIEAVLDAINGEQP